VVVLTTAVSAHAPAITLEHVLQDFFAALVLEIDVDVRRLVALLGEKALEQHVMRSGSISVMPKANTPPSWPPSPGPGTESFARAKATMSCTVRK
jgi:hypothetical protein